MDDDDILYVFDKEFEGEGLLKFDFSMFGFFFGFFLIFMFFFYLVILELEEFVEVNICIFYMRYCSFLLM